MRTHRWTKVQVGSVPKYRIRLSAATNAAVITVARRSNRDSFNRRPPTCLRYPFFASRSEEHTSELQSRSDLVCRLLLEKKKNKPNVIVSSQTHYKFQSLY